MSILREFKLDYFKSRDFLANKFNHLLLMLVFLLFITPITEKLQVSFPLESILFLGIILLTLRAVLEEKKTMKIFMIVAFIAFIFSIIDQFLVNNVLSYPLFLLLHTLTYILIIAGAIQILMIRLITERTISQDTIKGAICVYFLIGILWALFYMLIIQFDAKAISIPANSSFNLTTFIYFSFTVLTTLGFGDIVPVSRYAVSFTILESISGQLFLAIFLARLIGLYMAQEKGSHNPSAAPENDSDEKG